MRTARLGRPRWFLSVPLSALLLGGCAAGVQVGVSIPVGPHTGVGVSVGSDGRIGVGVGVSAGGGQIGIGTSGQLPATPQQDDTSRD
jgi:hypothetical protein